MSVKENMSIFVRNAYLYAVEYDLDIENAYWSERFIIAGSPEEAVECVRTQLICDGYEGKILKLSVNLKGKADSVATSIAKQVADALRD